MRKLKDEQRQWLRDLSNASGLSLTQIAKRSGVSQTTLTRFMNNEGATHALSARTIAQLEAAMGTPYGLPPTLPAPKNGWPEEKPWKPAPETRPVELTEGDDRTQALLRMVPEGWTAWLILNERLAASGYRVGDLVLVDPELPAMPQDAVLVRFEQMGRAPPLFAFRIYEPPFVMTAPLDGKLDRPELVDHQKVQIVGVAAASLRPRRIHQA